jgi:FK506-binding nuclear protein
LVYTSPHNVDSDDEDADEKKDSPIPTILASLTPGKIEQASIDLILQAESMYLLESIGKNTIYITGNYIDSQEPMDHDLTPSEFDSDEDEVDLRDVSSDVEFEAEGLDLEDDDEDEDDSGRFEELSEASKPPTKSEAKGQKRTAQAMDVDAQEEKVSKNEKKKKRKGEDGKAVSATSDGTETSAAKASTSDDLKKDATSKKADKKEKKKSAETELPGGLKIKDSKTGEGKVAKQGSTISMRYIGKLTNGQVFDKNVKGKPFTFRLGAGEVIKGWDQGIVGMQPGGERVLTIPPTLAYGKQKQQGIPANSTLIFEVKCVDVK